MVVGGWWLVIGVGGWLGSVQKWDWVRLVISVYGPEPIAFARFPRGGGTRDGKACLVC